MAKIYHLERHAVIATCVLLLGLNYSLKIECMCPGVVRSPGFHSTGVVLYRRTSFPRTLSGGAGGGQERNLFILYL